MNQNLGTSLCCGVPAKFHGTCCGWTNAGWIENPQTVEDKAAMWDRQKAIEALPSSPMKTALLSSLQISSPVIMPNQTYNSTTNQWETQTSLKDYCKHPNIGTAGGADYCTVCGKVF